MMANCTEAIVMWLVKQEAIVEEDRELYQYAVFNLLFTIAPLIIVIVIGFFVGGVRQGVVLILPFVCIRKYSGGYHTKHASTCFVASTAILTVSMLASMHIACGLGLDIALVLAMSSLSVFSPVDSENRRLDAEEQQQYKKVARRIVIIFGMIYIILRLLHQDRYASCIAVGVILSAGTQLPCIVKLYLQKR